MIGQIIGLIVVGLIIGALARLITPGKQHMSMFATLALGVVGAIIGGLIGGLFNDSTNPFELNVLGFVFAVIAAVLLVGIAERMSSGRRSRTLR
ncbi:MULTISPECIES: GlsB/YeaQ/YmgE family stress response membrane protein [unclassified Blastococcus]